MSDMGNWLVMLGLAIVVVLATLGAATYAYFSEDRWGRPNEVVDQVRDKVSGDDAEDNDEQSEQHRMAA